MGDLLNGEEFSEVELFTNSFVCGLEPRMLGLGLFGFESESEPKPECLLKGARLEGFEVFKEVGELETAAVESEQPVSNSVHEEKLLGVEPKQAVYVFFEQNNRS